MRMKFLGAAILATGMLAATAGAAEARDGCGLGFHRTYYGFCRPNAFYRPYVVRPVYYGWRGPGWHRPWGWRHRYGWHRPWGWGHRHVGWRGGWHGGWHHGWRHRW